MVPKESLAPVLVTFDFSFPLLPNLLFIENVFFLSSGTQIKCGNLRRMEAGKERTTTRMLLYVESDTYLGTSMLGVDCEWKCSLVP